MVFGAAGADRKTQPPVDKLPSTVGGCATGDVYTMALLDRGRGFTRGRLRERSVTE